MTLAPDELSTLVSMDAGEIDRRIFVDEEIFEQEMRQIFGRAWLFLCHETQIPKPGDFFEAPMGRDNVLVVRQKDGAIRALVNTCTHRGNAVCRAEEGNTRNFMCTYHGWTFGLGGDLVGVPGLDKFYAGALDRKKHALRQVAQLDSYKGFVFGTFDPAAPPLHDYLGATGRLGLDLIAERGAEMEIVPGVQKFVVDCNWKFAVDNLFDWYHPQITHMSALSSGMFPEEAYDAFLAGAGGTDGGGAKTPEGQEITFKPKNFFDFVESIVVLGEYGHAIAGPPADLRNAEANAWRERPGAAAALGPVGVRVDGHPNIFPTLWITTTSQISLRVPRTPTSTELWWFSFVPKEASPEERAMSLVYQNHVFGPAGILEQDDGENWVQGTMHAAGAAGRRVPHALKMNLGRGKIIHEHGLARIEGKTNEHGQLWTYGAWAAWMSGCDWDTLRTRTVPGDVI
jgi:3-phenylpropionate/trans-cinnamate dioxygenase alpha subunit